MGAGFTASTTVSVGGQPCAALTVLSSVEIACTTPPGAEGSAEVQATRADDGAVATLSFAYEGGGASDEGGADEGGGEDGPGGLDDGGGDSGSSDGGGGDTGSSDGGGDTGSSGGGDTGSSGGGDTGSSDGGGDTGSSDGGEDPGPEPTTALDYCHVQWPCAQFVDPSTETAAVYVWIYEAGLTDSVGQGAGLTVEVGYGGSGTLPWGTGWSWTSAAYNVDTDGLSVGDHANDEYSTSFISPSAAGAYDYCGRVSLDGGATWAYCDLGGMGCEGDGSSDGYSSDTAGSMIVR
jgi:hypothetical protein